VSDVQPHRARLGRRTALRFVVSAASVSLLAACGLQAPPAATSRPTPSAPAEAAQPTTAVGSAQPTSAAGSAQPTSAAGSPQPKRGGTLRVGVAGDVARLDGQLYSSINTTWMSFDRLTAYDANLKPQPMLAESWELSSDATQLKLNLRKGVQFHTGREFTSDDVKFNVMWVRDPKVAAGALIQQSKWFTDVQTPDKYTAIFVSEQPRPAVFDFFEFFDIVDSATVQGPDRDQKLVGTGPFVQTEWVQGDHLTFKRFPNYWQKDLPYLDEIRVNIVKDPQTLSAQLEAGAVDVADMPSLIDFVRLRADQKYRALTVPSSTNVFGANATKPPTDNKLVRQALNYAIDRKRIVDVAFRGASEPLTLPWQPTSLAYDASKASAYAFDVDKAKSLLAQAGVSNVEFDITTNTSTAEWTTAAQVLQAALNDLGIKATIRPYETAAYLDQINNHKYTGMYVGSIAYASVEPVTIIGNSRHLDPSGNSNTGYTSEAYVRLWTDASTEADPNKRKALYAQINDLLLDESCVMPICSAPARMLTTASVNDIGLSQHGAFKYTSAWLS
jgi:peptide/nickel transport system substrate-binding protein